MTERPILMSAPMIRALLEGKKTQTRRVVKFPPWAIAADGIEFSGSDGGPSMLCRETGCFSEVRCPYGVAGNLLWVRETWRVSNKWDDTAPKALPFDRGMTIMYGAGGSRAHNENGVYVNDDLYPPTLPDWAGKTRVSIHMPRAASRISLKITEVRCERLRDISQYDCWCEGVLPERNSGEAFCDHPINAYEKLWESINGEGSWALNPWVWVVGFALQRGTAT